jgi:hypothetical protein
VTLPSRVNVVSYRHTDVGYPRAGGSPVPGSRFLHPCHVRVHRRRPQLDRTGGLQVEIWLKPENFGPCARLQHPITFKKRTRVSDPQSLVGVAQRRPVRMSRYLPAAVRRARPCARGAQGPGRTSSQVFPRTTLRAANANLRGEPLPRCAQRTTPVVRPPVYLPSTEQPASLLAHRRPAEPRSMMVPPRHR